MNLERLMGTEFDRDLYIAASLFQRNLRILYQDSCKVCKEILGVPPSGGLGAPESPIPGVPVFGEVVRFSAAFA
jgi:hypothetical protein